ncbi:MAG: hypothetical protein WCH44_02005 [Betaproteobacteria bacterium]
MRFVAHDVLSDPIPKEDRQWAATLTRWHALQARPEGLALLGAAVAAA